MLKTENQEWPMIIIICLFGWIVISYHQLSPACLGGRKASPFFARHGAESGDHRCLQLLRRVDGWESDPQRLATSPRVGLDRWISEDFHGSATNQRVPIQKCSRRRWSMLSVATWIMQHASSCWIWWCAVYFSNYVARLYKKFLQLQNPTHTHTKPCVYVGHPFD